ncbi:hypothetical protein LZG74_10900 [Dyadobacter sp. CY327]|uniref:hypothetical protein n=1 Tax=Dyadobacter sp. CY327 TaxID=2907301 RepID=UPI001F3C8BD1|nr:hypothetical protein [Dyadobacter sp. CY327]MCE7070814.1 hypothetical protein [Dyadobacter sp. CY327]
MLDTRTARMTCISFLALKYFVLMTVFTAGYMFQPCLAQGKKMPKSWKLGTASGLFPDLTPETLREGKNSGIERVELNWKPELVNGTPAERLTFAKKFYSDAKKACLVIWSTHIPYGKKLDLSETDPEKRPAILRDLKEYMDLAMEMKVKQIVIHPSTEPIADSLRASRIEACRESLEELAVYCWKKSPRSTSNAFRAHVLATPARRSCKYSTALITSGFVLTRISC